VKTEIEIKCENNKTCTIIGNRHKIKLITGEVIKVATDKRHDYWFVTDIESGLAIVSPSYYGLLCFDDEHDVFTENNALDTAKFCVDAHLKSKNISFEEWRKERLSELIKEKI
jgi:hypothetical protein